jgi:hypothetical protein
MNCIDAEIEGGPESGQLTGRSITVANLPGYADVPEGESGVPITQALYDAEKTITISRGNGGNPVKVKTQIADDLGGSGQPPVTPVQQQLTQSQQQKSQSTGVQTPQTTSQQPNQSHGSQTSGAGNLPINASNPKNRPLVERMNCTPGPPTCEDDTTYIQCAPDNWAYRKFCGVGFKCVMEGSSGAKVNNCVPEKTY